MQIFAFPIRSKVCVFPFALAILAILHLRLSASICGYVCFIRELLVRCRSCTPFRVVTCSAAL